MKNIKFRFWDKEKKTFLQGTHFNKSDIEDPFKNFGKHIEVMSYVGLNDKNGTWIFEGDIVQWEGVNGGIPGGKIGGKDVVNYDSEKACFKFGNFTFVEDANQFNDNFPDYDSLEVIGNIYQNPELLKAN